jgi:HlyD family secretion protein
MKKSLFCVAALLLSACGDSGGGTYQGYAEGDYLRLGPRDPGIVSTLTVVEGDDVDAGAPLFSVDADRARLAVEQAGAQLQAAEARAADLAAGGRREEVSAARDQLNQARGDLKLAEENHIRAVDLVERGVAPRQRLDEAERTLNTANSRVAELENRLRIAVLPARDDQIVAARQEADAARAALAQAQSQLDDRSVRAPAAGRVDRIYLRPGEFASAGQPVVSILPPENIKVVFFIPEPQLAGVSVGMGAAISCDNCVDDIEARVSFVADGVEFTPPIIYSEDERSKLVYRVEARPTKPRSLKPGQPLRVRLSP